MNFIHGIIIYVFIINVCVVARGLHEGHGHAERTAHHGAHGRHMSASHAHYTYHPPRYIAFTCRHCTSAEIYPVYRLTPPAYVYAYKDSGSRYRDILTGLSLYNLGRAAHIGWFHTHQYTVRPEERCSLQVIEKAHFEEFEFPCFMISSFIETGGKKPSNKTRLVDIASSQINVKPFIRDTGPPLEVTKDQECVLWHNLTTQKERNHVPCALLKEYANTVKPAGVPVYIWLPTLLGTVIAVYLCCECFCKNKEKEVVKEEAPLNELRVPGYCASY
ncbi:unnamed protein product [Chrysodeixis includens]|uniref:Uncharacterized protein n=1 Tax=Chrysodeixis includens TaxID=689277 RepID=A0A9P0BV10_CHRIL|nr:unnamed protein product [Chrysodeixis includens]